MAALRHISNKLLNNIKSNEKLYVNNSCAVCMRLLNYNSVEYDNKKNPAPLFFNKEVQSILKILTRTNLEKVFKKRKLGDKKLEEPTYQFMTDEQLQNALSEAQKKADELLQMPPVVNVRQPIDIVLSRDPALKGLETSRLVFTDITFGIKDSDRLIFVREPDGDLKQAEWQLRDRVNQVYFPTPGRTLKPPAFFQDKHLDDLLNRREYEFVLDSACIQFEPNDPEYQRVVSITYQHANDHNGFETLRSTRHFGTFAFFLTWNQNIDNLLLELIETAHVEEAAKLLTLYGKIHQLEFNAGDGDELNPIEDYIKKCSNKKGALELAVQAYRELRKERQELERGIKFAHGQS